MEKAKQLGVEVEVVAGSSEQDVKTQIQGLKSVLYDDSEVAVLISPNSSNQLNDSIERLDQQGVKYMFLDTPIPADSFKSPKSYCGFIGTDNQKIGELAASFILKQSSVQNIVMVRGDSNHLSSTHREEGFLKYLKENSKGKNLIVVDGMWSREIAKNAIRKLPKIKFLESKVDAIFAFNDPMALGISDYYKERKLLKKPIIVGVDGILIGQRGLLKHDISATVVQSPEAMGKLGVDQLLKCHKSPNEYPVHISTPVTLIQNTTGLESVNSL